MVKCLIRIKTKVNIHLRMINHCYRDVKVRVLTLGPRLLGNVLGALPIIPSLPESSSSSGISLSPYGRSQRATDSLPIRSLSTPDHSIASSPSLLSTNSTGPECGNEEAKISEGTYKPSSNVFPTPEFVSTLDQEVEDPESVTPKGATLAQSVSHKPGGRASNLGNLKPSTGGSETHQTCEIIGLLARLVLVTLASLLAILLVLIAITESKLDVLFLRDIRETPEFQQLHYTYFCPLRRWLTCTLRWIGVHLIKE
ncbi:FERM domain-containing protein 5 isoform X4 [Silurus asotus]|uniref:FERM domain-containing protein 5 isoform X4 n=1 Tax=Silurus asotus TaxID=30991 RepID=A0AAD5FI29_SILAS|nr:FERM domain-containing protein 5 isoform X4 [Silurus asotus]